MKNLILFDADEINQIITIGGENLRRRTLEPIERAINVLKTMPDLKLLDVEHVIFRVATLQALLDSMRETLGEKVYKDVMRQAGENIGASFAKDLINFLITAGRFPQDEKTLIRLWNELDTTANWGKFSTKYEDGQIVVAIKENFLTRGKTQNQHQYCSFMEGYIQGFLWYALKDYYQWFKQNVTQPATRPLQPTKIIEKQADGVCTFIVELEEEKLPDAFDLFGDAKAAYSAGDFSKSANHLRSAIEIAFKLNQDVETFNLGVELLLAGIDEEGTHLYTINQAGKPIENNQIGFQAIGIGNIHAINTLISEGYSPNLDFEKAIELRDKIEKLQRKLEIK